MTYPFIETYCHKMSVRKSYSCRLEELHHALDSAECVVIGAGAGLSAAAGLEYSGRRFTEHFGDFITRYGFTDMYTSSFYPFRTEEERWAYWARHIEKAGFDRDRIFAVQGDYAYLQCAAGCHDRLYYNEELVHETSRQTADCRIRLHSFRAAPYAAGRWM